VYYIIIIKNSQNKLNIDMSNNENVNDPPIDQFTIAEGTVDETGLYESKVAKKLTICEIHRQLYKLLKDTPQMTDTVRFLLESGFVTGKKMHYRLSKYKLNWREDVYIKNLKEDFDKISQDKPIEWKDWDIK